MCQVDTNTYLVQLYEWFVGEPLHQVLLTLEDFMSRNTVFYDDAEWMKFAYDHERGVRVTCEHQRGLL
ncbi:hypothetical protein [Mycobacterium sp. 852002-51163_SCH5372311]|uniref:hypothetical protein n=1 Tax=Mycobacterium sp. 852002-51163_SCH5372311 TaxID=1834097 RepID=UPI0012E7C2E0|nr:hypothetical protein [Mycobacterium sp. 852002-51163_SCH5372311]